MADEPQLTRQSLELLQAFKGIENDELREFIVRTVAMLRHSPVQSWTPFREALCKLLCESA